MKISIPCGPASITENERRILQLAANGQTNAQIGAEMGLSPKTVKFYLAAANQKLGTKNRTEACVLAWKNEAIW